MPVKGLIQYKLDLYRLFHSILGFEVLNFPISTTHTPCSHFQTENVREVELLP